MRHFSTSLRPIRSKFKDAGIASGTVGAMAELLVSVDLMKRGHAVFRALSQACICDVLTIKDGKTITFEVRTGVRNKDGRISFPKIKIRANYVAVVFHDKPTEIHYFDSNTFKLIDECAILGE